MDYAFSVGTGDPLAFSAETDADAIRTAASFVRERLSAVLRDNPQSVATLIGADRLITRPSERIDEFVHRLGGTGRAAEEETVQPGDLSAPDCNGD